MAWRTRPLQLILSGGPVAPTPTREYNGLRCENRSPFKGQQASASNPVMQNCRGCFPSSPCWNRPISCYYSHLVAVRGRCSISYMVSQDKLCTPPSSRQPGKKCRKSSVYEMNWCYIPLKIRANSGCCILTHVVYRSENSSHICFYRLICQPADLTSLPEIIFSPKIDVVNTT